ncbi:unnamed protein product [Lactuca saligna]|uniref:Uncharacterized protein n=1 Tax=Lactuca saligna TaxID=75948 RepID=A0AA36EEI3_LACSI|nr:unnamed protein product [Lactuca saligna]
MDVEIIVVLKKKPILKPKEESKLGKIRKENWSVVYQRKTDQKVQRCIFFLLDKHVHSTYALNYILELTEACKLNDDGDKKCFYNMIKCIERDSTYSDDASLCSCVGTITLFPINHISIRISEGNFDSLRYADKENINKVYDSTRWILRAGGGGSRMTLENRERIRFTVNI